MLTAISDDIKRIFDGLIGDLYKLIDGQLQRMQTNHPHEQIVEFLSSPLAHVGVKRSRLIYGELAQSRTLSCLAASGAHPI